jgi:hypothetical protein
MMHVFEPITGDRFYGSAFFVYGNTAMTCHHNLSFVKNDIFVGFGITTAKAEFVQSDLNRYDIAVLRVPQIDPLIPDLRVWATPRPGEEVVLRGFPESTAKQLIGGEERRLKILGETMYRENETKVGGDKPWNTRPTFLLQVYECEVSGHDRLEKGLSGAPVVDREYNRLVGIFEAFKPGNDKRGFVIKINQLWLCLMNKLGWDAIMKLSDPNNKPGQETVSYLLHHLLA